jgi:hypothetical protein
MAPELLGYQTPTPYILLLPADCLFASNPTPPAPPKNSTESISAGSRSRLLLL